MILSIKKSGAFYNPQSNHLKNCKKRCNENHNIYIEMEYLKNIRLIQRKQKKSFNGIPWIKAVLGWDCGYNFTDSTTTAQGK